MQRHYCLLRIFVSIFLTNIFAHLLLLVYEILGEYVKFDDKNFLWKKIIFLGNDIP